MKRTTIKVWVDERAMTVLHEVKGYEVEVCGVPMVAHRKVEYGPDKELVTSEHWWTVSEPRSGMKITDEKTRAMAIERAQWKCDQVGAQKLEELIEGIERKVAEGGTPWRGKP